MKTAAIGAVGTLLLAGSLFLQGAAGTPAMTGDRVNDEFAGVISDSICAENGSHIGVVKNGHSHAGGRVRSRLREVRWRSVRAV